MFRFQQQHLLKAIREDPDHGDVPIATRVYGDLVGKDFDARRAYGNIRKASIVAGACVILEKVFIVAREIHDLEEDSTLAWGD